MIWEWICILDEITGILEDQEQRLISKKLSLRRKVSTPSLEEQIVRQEMKNWRHFSALFATTNHGELSQVNHYRSLSSWQKTICALDFENFSAAGEKTLCNIYRSVEKENSPPDEEMVEGRGRMLRPATTRIRPEFRLRNQTKQTQCDKIKAKPTLRCHLKIVCSRILLNCPRHLSRTEVPLHCTSNSSSVSDKLCKRPCFASCAVQPKGKIIIFRLP